MGERNYIKMGDSISKYFNGDLYGLRDDLKRLIEFFCVICVKCSNVIRANSHTQSRTAHSHFANLMPTLPRTRLFCLIVFVFICRNKLEKCFYF